MLEWSYHKPPVELNNSRDLSDYSYGFEDALRGCIFDPPKDNRSRVYYEIGYRTCREEPIPDNLMEKIKAGVDK